MTQAARTRGHAATPGDADQETMLAVEDIEVADDGFRPNCRARDGATEVELDGEVDGRMGHS